MLIRPLLSQVKHQCDAEKRAEENALLNSILEKRDSNVVNVFRKAKLDPAIVKHVSRLLQSDRDDRKGDSKISRYLAISRTGHEELLGLLQVLPKAQQSIRMVLREYREATEKADLLERRLSSIPSQESLADLIAKLTAKRKELGTLEGFHASIYILTFLRANHI